MNNLTVFLGNIINRFLGNYSSDIKDITGSEENSGQQEWLSMVKTLVRIIDQFMPVVMIGLGVVGAIWIIVLSIQYGKAESEDVKTEAKKKLINTIVGVCIGLLIMIVLTVWLKNSEVIAEWLQSAGTKDSDAKGWTE